MRSTLVVLIFLASTAFAKQTIVMDGPNWITVDIVECNEVTEKRSWNESTGAFICVPDQMGAGGAVIGYTLPLVAANTATTTDAQTLFFGCQAGIAAQTAADISRVYIPKAGAIKAAYIMAHANTAGTAEAWVCNIRLNNTSDTQIASTALSNVRRTWINAGLNIAVVAGDYIEIKCVNPTWATNPANVRFGGTVYIE